MKIEKIIESQFIEIAHEVAKMHAASLEYCNPTRGERSPLNDAFSILFSLTDPYIFGGALLGDLNLESERELNINDKKYFVDFVIKNEDRDLCFIELDGFAFHERSKDQFQYERQRQNDLIATGTPIFRFTFEDICKNYVKTISKLFNSLENFRWKEETRGMK